MHWKLAARLFFAVTLIAIGIIGFAGGTFAPIWAGVPKSLPDRQMLAYLCTFVSLGCGAGLLARRTAAPAALVLFLYLVAWTAAFKVPFIIRQPLVEVSYQSTGENLVLIAAAWALYAESPKGSAIGLWVAYFLYGLALIAFGFSHFAYLALTAPLVPTWLGAPVFWAYLTGCIYLVTGALLVTGIGARLGATLAAVQISLITLLVWGPLLLARDLSPMHWQETVVSVALSASAWVIAASLEARPWFEAPWSKMSRRRAAAA